MRPEKERYVADIDAINAMVMHVKPVTATTIQNRHVMAAYRLAFKAACRSLRAVIATETDTELRGLYTGQLRSLKHLHWQFLELERQATFVASLKN